MIREQFGKLYCLREFNKRGQFSFARTTKRFRSRDARQQSRLFAPENQSLRRSPNSNQLRSDCQR